MAADVSIITFRSGPELGRPARLPILQIGSLLDRLRPNMVRLEIVRARPDGTIVLLKAAFPKRPGNVTSVSDYFHQTVARLEGELDYDASWGDAYWFTSDEPWSFLEPHCQSGRLSSGKPLGFLFEASSVADKIYDLAIMNDVDVYFGVTLTRREPKTDAVRHLIPALAEIRDSQPALAAGLESIIRLGKSAGWSARECIGLPESGEMFKTVVESVLHEQFVQDAPYLFGDFLSLEWTDEPFSGELTGMADVVGNLRGPAYLQEIFRRLFAAGGLPADLGRDGALAAPLPGGSGDGAAGDYAFISYAHRNRAFAEALIGILQQNNIRFWFDDAIAPGATWDETLEAQIRNCAAVIACVSDDYRNSKYCRRELKFADLLHKPILPVSQGLWLWNEGMQLVFQEYQILNVLEGNGWKEAIKGLKRLAPQLKP